ncbi:MAG: cohesin domain-containing protein [Eubacteriales bacterium]
MKKFLSLFLVIASLVAMVLPMHSFAEDFVTVSVKDAEGFASGTVTVEIGIDDTTALSCAKLKIEYDSALELLYVEKGNFFAELQKSPIYNQDAGAQNGIYTYIGNHDMKDGQENSSAASGTFLYMTFKLPDDAKVGDTYGIDISKSSSELVRSSDGNLQDIDFSVSSATVTVVADGSCGSHAFEEEVVSVSSYLTPGFSYKRCLVCGYTEVAKEPAFEIDAFGYEGASIRYQGNPSGIAATFTVDEEVIEKIEEAGYDVEVGTTATYGDNILTRVYYGEGATESIKNGKMFSVVEGISVYSDVRMCAYIKIKDQTSNLSRTESLGATLKGKDEFSIQDVVFLMNISKYSDKSQGYLKSVLNGYAE